MPATTALEVAGQSAVYRDRGGEIVSGTTLALGHLEREGSP